MTILVASVMHTGTHFVTDILLEGYIDNQEYYQCHFDNKHWNKMTNVLKMADIIIIPLRHPVRCLASFRAKSRPFKFFQEQWDNMLKRDLNAHYVHIDDPIRRYKDVESFKHVLPVKDFDWAPTYKSGVRTHTHGLTVTDELLKEIPAEYVDFYWKEKNNA